MSFARSGRQFDWETQAAQNVEFVVFVSVREFSNHVTRVVRATSGLGVGVIQRHKTPLALLASPTVLFNVVMQRRMRHPPILHREAFGVLEQIAQTATPSQNEVVWIEWSVHSFLQNVHRADFMNWCNACSVGIVITRHRQSYGVLLGVAGLARLWRDLGGDAEPPWVNGFVETLHRHATPSLA
jgi:hypothetical protein